MSLLDLLLMTAIASLCLHLFVLLSWPAIEAWQHRPQRGMQVSQHYDLPVTEDAKNVTMPANYLLYLPSEYTWRSKWPLVVYLHGSGSRGQDLDIVRREGLPGLVEQGKKFDFTSFATMPSKCWMEPGGCCRLDRTHQQLSVG